jgi:hypothetical protein
VWTKGEKKAWTRPKRRTPETSVPQAYSTPVTFTITNTNTNIKPNASSSTSIPSLTPTNPFTFPNYLSTDLLEPVPSNNNCTYTHHHIHNPNSPTPLASMSHSDDGTPLSVATLDSPKTSVDFEDS